MRAYYAAVAMYAVGMMFFERELYAGDLLRDITATTCVPTGLLWLHLAASESAV